jgi:hypothetical protein
MDKASKLTLENSVPTFVMPNISEPKCLLEKLPERMQEKKTRKAGIEVPILILISAA